MILGRYVVVKCSSRKKKYYNSLGYDVVNGDEFTIPIEYLPNGSGVKINVKCDVCGHVKKVSYRRYILNTNCFSDYYACSKKCAVAKVKKRNIERYGVDNISKTKYFKDKYKKVMNERYGVDNGFQSEEIKKKIKESSIKKYGVDHYRKNEEIKRKYCYGIKTNFYIDGRSYTKEDGLCENNERNKWRNKVYKRDNYTCKICGDNTGGNLNAHHINSRNLYPEQRFSVDNGITLCETCHKKFHKKYGYGNNTKKQFKDFIAGCNDYPDGE